MKLWRTFTAERSGRYVDVWFNGELVSNQVDKAFVTPMQNRNGFGWLRFVKFGPDNGYAVTRLWKFGRVRWDLSDHAKKIGATIVP